MYTLLLLKNVHNQNNNVLLAYFMTLVLFISNTLPLRSGCLKDVDANILFSVSIHPDAHGRFDLSAQQYYIIPI